MNEEKFINQLLNALDDRDVKEKIVNIISEYNKKEKEHCVQNSHLLEIKTLKQKLMEETKEKDRLLKELEKYKTEKSKLEYKNVQLESQFKCVLKEKTQEYENLQQQYKKQIKELEQVCSLYKDRYKNIEYYYNQYLSLGENVHKKLGRILNAESPEIFLAWGTQWDNIKALWTEISFWLDEYSRDDVHKLIEIFDYFFDIYYENNSYSGQKKYVRQEVSVGDEFDDFLYTRKGGAVAGKIKEILLLGYGQMDGEDFKLKEKSIVRI